MLAKGARRGGDLAVIGLPAHAKPESLSALADAVAVLA
jgi:hypothetical protein